MVGFLSSMLVVAVLAATRNVVGQQQPMMNSGSYQYCGYNEQAVSYCGYYGCPSSTYCNGQTGVCCRSNVVNPLTNAACPAGRAELGPCLNSNCQSGAQCLNNRCCSTCPVNFASIGPCIAGNQCPPPATCQNGMCCQGNNGRK